MTQVVVQKFGSSVLPSEAALPGVVNEVYHTVRRGRRVVMIVSAFGGETDRLQARARAYGEDLDAIAHASLLATGELTSASLAVLALERAGIRARLLDSSELRLRTRGSPLDAAPVALDDVRLQRAIADFSVVVIPGFVGRDEQGRTTLLGRGGSDLSALFVARALRAPCELIKDVDGLYTDDPAADATAACYGSVSWQTAARIGGSVVQSKAVQFAQEGRQEFVIRAPGRNDGTRVGPGPNRLRSPQPVAAKRRVLLLGLGTVGLGVWHRLSATQELFEVAGIWVRDTHKPRPTCVPNDLLAFSAPDALERDYDLLVEVAGAPGTARAAITHALERGRDVVTANKEVMSADGCDLQALATKQGARLLYSAAVGGAVPCLELVRRVRRDGGVASLQGVLNGTTNFMLDRLMQGQQWSRALAAARAAGFAEADPSADLDGVDAARKLALLVHAASGRRLPVSAIECDSIRGLEPTRLQELHAEGRRLRAVAEADFGAHGVNARVRLRAVHEDEPLGQLTAEDNAIMVSTRDGRSELWRGKGAGRWPTAEAVFADLLDLAMARYASDP